MNIDGKISVLCYGDSNTYGYDPNNGKRYPKEVIWTTILSDMLGDEYEVVSQGVVGRTTAYDRNETDWQNGLDTIAATVSAHLPLDYIVIMLGTNDCNIDLKLSPEDIADGMRQLVLKARVVTDRYQDKAPKIIIVAPAAIRPEIEGTPLEEDLDETSIEKSHAIAPLYEKLADELDCLYVDATDRVDVSPVDCEHLTVNGHKQLAELIYSAIKNNN